MVDMNILEEDFRQFLESADISAPEGRDLISDFLKENQKKYKKTFPIIAKLTSIFSQYLQEIGFFDVLRNMGFMK